MLNTRIKYIGGKDLKRIAESLGYETFGENLCKVYILLKDSKVFSEFLDNEKVVYKTKW